MPLNPDFQTIALAVPVRMDTYYLQFARAFERYVSSYGYRVIVTSIGHLSNTNVVSDIEMLLTCPVSGIVLIDMPEAFHQSIGGLCPKGWPIVSVGASTLNCVDSVTVNFEPGVAEAVEFLLNNVKERIAFFAPEMRDEMMVVDTLTSDPSKEVRLVTYERLMNLHHRKPELIPGNRGDRRASRIALREYIAEYDHPSAIFCHNDDMAIAANFTLHDLGLNVPNDVQLIGCDGIAEVAEVTPAISSVEQPLMGILSKTIELIERRTKTPDSDLQHFTVDSKFVQRESTCTT